MTEAEQVRQRVAEMDRRAMDIQRELRFREALPRFRALSPGLDVQKLESSLLRPVDSELRALTVESLEEEIRIIKREVALHIEYMTYGLGMSRMFLEEPDAGPTPYTRANYPSSAAVVAIIPRSEFTEDAGRYTLSTEPLTEVVENRPLCDVDMYYGQPAATIKGTGFLIDGARIVTAGHVVGGDDWLDTVYFVFDYAWKADENPNLEFDSTQLFVGDSIVGKFWESGVIRKRDWAVIQLETDPGRSPLLYRESGSIDEGDGVYMIGHPNGLPQMYTGVGTVLDATACWRMKVELDSYTFSSGSPVINDVSEAAEGILVWDVGTYLPCDVCSIRGVYGPEYGFAGAEAVRCTDFAEWLKHPTTVVVATEVDYAEVTSAGTKYQLSLDGSAGDPEVAIDAPNGVVKITVTSGCETHGLPNAGERWKVAKADGQLTLRRDCLH